MSITQLTEFAADELVSRANVNSRVTDINSTIEALTPLQLYYNASGTSSTIPLGSSISTYKAIEIFFFIDWGSGTWKHSVKIYNNGEVSCETSLTSTLAANYNNSPRVKVYASNISLTGDTLTWPNNRMANITGSNTSIATEPTDDTPKIYKVVGYKY